MHHVSDFKQDHPIQDLIAHAGARIVLATLSFLVTYGLEMLISFYGFRNPLNLRFRFMEVMWLDESEAIPFFLWSPEYFILPILAVIITTGAPSALRGIFKSRL